MTMMHLIAAGFLAVVGEPARLAARCLPPPPLCDAAAGADLVFFGEVFRQTTYPEQTERGLLPQGIQAVRFKVIRAFKGVEPTESWGLFYFGVEAKPWSIPVTCVTDYSGDMGNTVGPRGFSIGSRRQVSSSKYPPCRSEAP